MSYKGEKILNLFLHTINTGPLGNKVAIHGVGNVRVILTNCLHLAPEVL